MSIGIAYNPCKNCKEMDKCSICELTYYRKGYIKFPTADVVEVRHGCWVRYGYDALQCSLCGAVNTNFIGNNFCPRCGAKMDGERREENEG